ncbi:MAG: multiprotein bridging factor aMBF1 [Thermoplasmata archaeon]
MPLCEMCGAEQERLRAVSVEGTRLMLCDRCSRFGEEIRPAKTASARRPPPPRTPRALPDRPATEPEYDLASDFPDRLRRAREARGWKREELARRINEKLSVLEKLEKGRMRPPDTLVAKLERILEIRLRERIEEGEGPAHTEAQPLTLGDLIRRED